MLIILKTNRTRVKKKKKRARYRGGKQAISENLAFHKRSE